MPISDLSLATQIAILGSGFLLATGILTGTWKYRHVHSSETHRAPVYVNIAHQASLAYAFSSGIIAILAHLSHWSGAVNAIAVILLLSQFLVAVATYIVHGFDRSMTNQFAPPFRLGKFPLSAAFMRNATLLLIGCETLGIAILLSGVCAALVT